MVQPSKMSRTQASQVISKKQVPEDYVESMKTRSKEEDAPIDTVPYRKGRLLKLHVLCNLKSHSQQDCGHYPRHSISPT